MTTKVLGGLYSGAYYLASPVTTLSIAASGYLAGGLLATASGTYTVVNAGVISTTNAGVALPGAEVVTNTGTIRSTSASGVYVGTGSITNGGSAAPLALIRGYTGVFASGAATVVNGGAIAGSGIDGVYLRGGGAVDNGSLADPSALVEGVLAGVALGQAGAVTNDGRILASGTAGVGVLFAAGGTVVNDAAGTIEAARAVDVKGGAGTVVNYGAIRAFPGASTGVGVVLEAGGSVVNGSAAANQGLIEGASGVLAMASASIDNYGSIAAFGGGFYSRGIDLEGGGSVTNAAGGRIDASAGVAGVFASNAAVTVLNQGTILGAEYGVVLKAGGSVTNGDAAHPSALITARAGYGAAVEVSGAGTIVNLATIAGGVAAGYGVELFLGGALTNGSVQDTTALIEGSTAVGAYRGTLVNFGTLSGSRGPNFSIASFGASLGNSSLVNERGGLVVGFYGVELDGSSRLTNFGFVEGTGGTGARIAGSSSLLLEAGSTVVGEVSDTGGTIWAVGGTSTVSGVTGTGSIVGRGVLKLDGGASQLQAGLKLLAAEILVDGAATSVTVAGKVGDSRIWSQAAGTLSISSGGAMIFAGKADSFSGTVTGAGAVEFAGGTDTFANLTLSIARATINKAVVTLAGAIDLTGTLRATTTGLTIDAGGANISGGGLLLLSNTPTNLLKGASAASVLTLSAGRIEGAGDIGGGVLSLTIGAAGTIESLYANGLTIDTGAKAIVNDGLIAARTGGGVSIKSALVNGGTLETLGGTLTVTGAVSGTGTVRIVGGLADFAAAFGETVIFGTSGVLALGQSVAYGRTITGFSTSGATSLDLKDIAFSGSTTVSYSGTASSGILTVSDGTHTARIKLKGDYLASTFVLDSDGHGGTSVHDPAASPAGFAATMAALAPDSATAAPAVPPAASAVPRLAAPHS